MDEPIFGHGAWARDVSGKYQSLFSDFRNDQKVTIVMSKGSIPAHSILVGAGTSNGIFAFLFMFAILLFFVKTGFKAIDKRDPYLFIVISYILAILWDFLFAPSTLFRLRIPLYFATILASYFINKQFYETKKQNQIVN